MKRWLLAFALMIGASTLAAAQEEAPTDPGADRAATFRAVSGPQAERVPGGTLTVVAYGAAWVLVLGYLWRLGRMHAANTSELAALRKTIDVKSD